MAILDVLKDNFDYNEPITIDEIRKALSESQNHIYKSSLKNSKSKVREVLNDLIMQELLIQIDNKYFYLKNPDSYFKNFQTVRIDKLIEKEFIQSKNSIFGYETGITFANYLKLTTQTASVKIVASNRRLVEKSKDEKIRYKVVLKKPLAKVTNENYKLLQILELLKDFDDLSDEPLQEAAPKMLQYIDNKELTLTTINKYLKLCSKEVIEKWKAIGELNESTSAKGNFSRSNNYCFRFDRS